MSAHRIEGWSFLIAAGTASHARHAARIKATQDGHPSPRGPILWVEDIGPAPFGGRFYEVVIAVIRNRRDLDAVTDQRKE